MLVALYKESAKAFHYVSWFYAVAGVVFALPLVRVRPWLAVPLVLAGGNTLLIAGLARSAGYLSERHTLPVVLMGTFFAAYAMQELPRRMRGLPGVGPVLDHPATKWVTLLAILLSCLPATLKSLHENRHGHRLIGAYLREHAGPEDAIIDPYNWAQYYSGRSLRARAAGPRPPAVPLGRVGRGRDAALDADAVASGARREERHGQPGDGRLLVAAGGGRQEDAADRPLQAGREVAVNPITVESRRQKPATVAARHPGAAVVDVTSKGPQPWVRFSPFYPHGGVPIPHTPGTVAQSVEGLWQGLKVFATEDIDPAKWAVTTMAGIKRGGAKRGPVAGHRSGVGSETILGYRAARYHIYLPAYLWVLTHNLTAEVQQLREMLQAGPVVLLDYETNGDVDDLARPLSHAALVAAHLAGAWPVAGGAAGG